MHRLASIDKRLTLPMWMVGLTWCSPSASLWRLFTGALSCKQLHGYRAKSARPAYSAADYCEVALDANSFLGEWDAVSEQGSRATGLNAR
jgi:hypothetical protein